MYDDATYRAYVSLMTTDEYLRWANETFPDATPQSCIAHLMEEVSELIQDLADPMEFADAYMLLIHAVHLAGIDLEDAILKKLSINQARTWGKKNEDGYWKHKSDI